MVQHCPFSIGYLTWVLARTTLLDKSHLIYSEAGWWHGKHRVGVIIQFLGPSHVPPLIWIQQLIVFLVLAWWDVGAQSSLTCLANNGKTQEWLRVMFPGLVFGTTHIWYICLKIIMASVISSWNRKPKKIVCVLNYRCVCWRNLTQYLSG